MLWVCVGVGEAARNVLPATIMDLSALLYSFGLSGLFSSRAFLPAFATSLVLRYGDQVPLLKSVDFLQSVGNEPNWFTHGGVVAAFGILALVELVAEKSPELREIFDTFSVYAKTGISGLTTMGILSASDAQFVGGMVQEAGIFDMLPAVLSASATYFGATIRGGVMGMLTDADPDDTVKIRGFISWIEEIWSSWGVVLIVLYAPIMIAVIAGFFGMLALIRKRHEGKLEEAKVLCRSCGQRIHSFATKCHHCDTEVESPNVLGFLGGLKPEKAGSIREQELRLLRLKRSPVSGERFEGKGVQLKCEEDGRVAFSDPELNRAYFDAVSAKLPRVLLVSAVFGFVPVLGLLVGVIYYRLRLVAPFRRYLTFGQSFLTKWLVRLILLVLVYAQLFGGGIIAVPLMAALNYWFYRSAFKSALKEQGLLRA